MTNTVPRPLPFRTLAEMEAHFWSKNDPLAQGIQGIPGPQGEPGPQGLPGEKGDPGDDGQAVRIRWVVASALDLPAVNVAIGDGALVGAGEPYNLYVYTDESSPHWVNAGLVSMGPQGPQGIPGAQGIPGPQGPQPPLAGSGVATTAARSDHNHTGVYAAASHVHDAAAITTGTLGVSRIPSLDAAKITTGTFVDARIPNLAATKITSGVFADARIPSLAASKITSGVFDVARMPDLSTSDITSGVFLDARIPSLAASKITTGTFADARIPNLNASKITAGAFSVDRIPTMTMGKLFPNNATSNSYSSSAMRVAPGNEHSVITTLGSGWGLHDTGYRQNTDELWAYVMVPGLGFGWIPENRI